MWRVFKHKSRELLLDIKVEVLDNEIKPLDGLVLSGLDNEGWEI